MSAFLAGLLAGLGVAVPLGAIGVLLVQEAITNGWHPAAAGATGVALVDLGYAVLAVSAGAAVTAVLAGHQRQVQVAGAAVLLLVVARGLLALRRTGGGSGSGAAGGIPGVTRNGAPVLVPPTGSPWRVLRRFVGLTALNPLTALYFVILTAGLGDRLGTAAARTWFVAGVFAASWAWQLVLAAVGTVTGARMPPWARTATSMAGYAVVTGYAVRLALG